MEIRTEILIEAPPERVWGVLVDFDAYPDWNPFISVIRGHLEPGEKLHVELQPPGGRQMTFRPTVLRAAEAQELRWLGHLLMPGLLDGEHFFRLTRDDEGKTRFVHGEDFRGILRRFANVGITRAARGFVAMNAALRKRVLEVG